MNINTLESKEITKETIQEKIAKIEKEQTSNNFKCVLKLINSTLEHCTSHVGNEGEHGQIGIFVDIADGHFQKIEKVTRLSEKIK
jgi:hypothetical protein